MTTIEFRDVAPNLNSGIIDFAIDFATKIGVCHVPVEVLAKIQPDNASRTTRGHMIFKFPGVDVFVRESFVQLQETSFGESSEPSTCFVNRSSKRQEFEDVLHNFLREIRELNRTHAWYAEKENAWKYHSFLWNKKPLVLFVTISNHFWKFMIINRIGTAGIVKLCPSSSLFHKIGIKFTDVNKSECTQETVSDARTIPSNWNFLWGVKYYSLVWDDR